MHWKHLPDSSLTTVYSYPKVFWGSQCLDGPSVHHFGLSWNISKPPDGLAQNSMQTFMVPRRWIKMSPKLFLRSTMRVTFAVMSEISPKILGADIHVLLRKNSENCGDFSCRVIIRAKLWFVQYFGLWTNGCKTNDIPTSDTLCLMPIKKQILAC